MTRPKSVPGEKPLFWTGSSKDDLLAFPEAVIDEIGTCSSPILCARHEKDFFLLSASSSVWDCRLIRRPAKMLAENVNRALAGLRQKIALESMLRLHNDGAARRVSAGIESGLHAQSGFP